MGASAEPREASARRWKTGALPAAAVVCGLIPACRHTGTVGVISRVVPRSSEKPHAPQPVSTQALGEVHTRMTTRIGAPQGGQRAAHGGGRGARGRLAIAGGYWLHHQADGRGRDGTAGMEQAAMPDFPKAIGEAVLEEPAEKLHDVEVRGAWAG